MKRGKFVTVPLLIGDLCAVDVGRATMWNDVIPSHDGGDDVVRILKKDELGMVIGHAAFAYRHYVLVFAHGSIGWISKNALRQV